MSVARWRYTERCDEHICPGDCDHCSVADPAEDGDKAEEEP